MLDRLPQFIEQAKERNVDVNLHARLFNDDEEENKDRELIEEFLDQAHEV